MISENHVHLGLAFLGTYYYSIGLLSLHLIWQILQRFLDAENCAKYIYKEVDGNAHKLPQHWTR